MREGEVGKKGGTGREGEAGRKGGRGREGEGEGSMRRNEGRSERGGR